MSAAETSDKIKCEIDGAMVHSIQLHIEKNYAGDWTLDRYKTEFPGSPLMSEMARKVVLKKKREIETARAEAAITRKPMAEVFNLPAAKVKNARGEPITVRVFQPSDLGEDDAIMIPDIDENYIFPIEATKAVLMAWEVGKTIYNWGLHGTGKTTLFKQVAAHTRRPFLRIQHTIGTEEAHILGQMNVVKEVDEATGEIHTVTKFIPGPLPLAMMHGWVYCADEYDGALPAVSLLYQSVLEREPLYIKDAPLEFRMIKPHPNFRFCATGNTNGSGDETGLYQGTQIQNAANYSRFNITIETDYPEPKIEASIVARQGGVKLADAEKLIGFATEWRKSFRAGQVAMTVSPRELIEAANVGMIRGGDWHGGMSYAFANRLPRTDKEVASQMMQRIFGRAAEAA